MNGMKISNKINQVKNFVKNMIFSEQGRIQKN